MFSSERAKRLGRVCNILKSPLRQGSSSRNRVGGCPSQWSTSLPVGLDSSVFQWHQLLFVFFRWLPHSKWPIRVPAWFGLGVESLLVGQWETTCLQGQPKGFICLRVAPFLLEIQGHQQEDSPFFLGGGPTLEHDRCCFVPCK